MGTQEDRFEVTAEWIHRHSTPAGAWTKRALAILGVSWPPSPGWIRRSTGKLLTQHERTVFEGQGRRRMAEQPHFIE